MYSIFNTNKSPVQRHRSPLASKNNIQYKKKVFKSTISNGKTKPPSGGKIYSTQNTVFIDDNTKILHSNT